MKKSIIALLGIACLLMLTGCADQLTFEQAIEVAKPVGFWHGLWHGMVLPFSWIGSLFSDNITIYCIANNGGWYNFGFALGAGAVLGGASSSAKSRS
jgi:hypothetical protein